MWGKEENIMELEQLLVDAKRNKKTLKLMKDSYEKGDMEDVRLWVGYGIADYLIKLHEYFVKENHL